MNNVAVQPQVSYTITILNGPDKGTIFRLNSSEITIGRGMNNDIPVPQDLLCSRQHAKIKFTNRGIQITNLSKTKKLFVDGIECNEHYLKPSSKFVLGETKFQLQILPVETKAVPIHMKPHEAPLTSTPQKNFDSPSPQRTRSRNKFRSSRRKQRSPIFYILIGVIVLFAWLLTGKKKSEEKVELRTQQDIDLTIQSHKEKMVAQKKARAGKGFQSEQFKEAQSNFVTGFRDYRKGQFERALQSFQACLSLFPSHNLCQRYLILSKKKYNELIQYHMVLGRKYMSQNQFKSCKAAFRNVMVMVKNSQSKIYKEAKAAYEACHSYSEGRY